MPFTTISRIAVFITLAASSALAAPEPSTTAALQTFLSISNIDASQGADLSTRFEADKTSYKSELQTDPAYISALNDAAAYMPETAMAKASADPDVYVASLAQASSTDLPSWFKSLPTDDQDVWRSIGSRYIEMYTSEVAIVRPLSSDVAASISSVEASASSAIASSQAKGVKRGAAPASPLTNGHMGVIAGGVAIAAGLVGMALL
ncbi:MAG: hypothetical protein Q9213_004221 [Squamulea squamosa]